jgi:mono/diheme cytochrome c family protein
VLACPAKKEEPKAPEPTAPVAEAKAKGGDAPPAKTPEKNGEEVDGHAVHHRESALSTEALSQIQRGAAKDASPLARGKYLTSAVVDCVHCHTHRHFKDYMVAFGPNYAGGEEFGEAWKMPGTLITPNITPDKATGLGDWTDDEIKAAIRNGVNKKGERLFPLMPSHYFQRMSDEDLNGIVAFLKSLKPLPMASEKRTKLAIKRTELPPLPPITKPVPAVGPEDPIKRGEYLVTLANCRTCHSPTQKGQEIKDRFMAGGVYFTGPFGSFPTPNITPDPETGLGKWSDEEIKAVLTTGKRKSGLMLKYNLMPWWLYRNLTDADLDAIVAYLRSLKPVKNDIFKKENQFPLGG